jgi:dihydrofolate synthase/folylpolyglutamate synthase
LNSYQEVIMMTYEAALAYLESLATFGSQLGLARIEKLLDLMGNPQNCYKTLHVTGTNGKGSTAAMLTAILTTAGISTALYTSPHLAHYTERMRINNSEVSRQEFAAVIACTACFVAQMVQAGFEHPTEFEVLTAAAFQLFAEKKVEYAVIEVGLGGLLDSTNVIIPELSIITNVALDHTDRCGTTVEQIAIHKAGIIKQGRPVITAATGAALQVITQQAVKFSSVLTVYGKDFFSEVVSRNLAGQKIRFVDQRTKLTAQTPLLGAHQAVNGALALAAALTLSQQDRRVTEAVLQQGLEHTNWPGRFEVCHSNPVVIFDGAHNPAGVKVLRRTLTEYFPDRSVVFVLGILRDKAIAEMLTELLSPQDKVVVTLPLSERACPAGDVAQQIQQLGIIAAVQVENNICEALASARQLAGPEGIVCVAGSLYLIGAARGCFQ